MGDQEKEKENLAPEGKPETGSAESAGEPAAESAPTEATESSEQPATETTPPASEAAAESAAETATGAGADTGKAPPAESESSAAPEPEPEPVIVYEPVGDGPFYGTGRRKTSVAKVYLKPGSGQIVINGRAPDEYFNSPIWRIHALEPLTKYGLEERYDARISVQGGGNNGQAGALRMGIARALAVASPDLRKELRKSGFLTRDARRRERKKPGQKGARRRFQWTKR